MNIQETTHIYTPQTPTCPCCCSAYMIETEVGWVCPVCGTVVSAP